MIFLLFADFLPIWDGNTVSLDQLSVAAHPVGFCFHSEVDGSREDNENFNERFFVFLFFWDFDRFGTEVRFCQTRSAQHPVRSCSCPKLFIYHRRSAQLIASWKAADWLLIRSTISIGLSEDNTFEKLLLVLITVY